MGAALEVRGDMLEAFALGGEGLVTRGGRGMAATDVFERTSSGSRSSRRSGSPDPRGKSAKLRMEQLRIFQSAAAYEGNGAWEERTRSLFESGLPNRSAKFLSSMGSSMEGENGEVDLLALGIGGRSRSRDMEFQSKVSRRGCSLRLMRTSYPFQSRDDLRTTSTPRISQIIDDDDESLVSESDSDSDSSSVSEDELEPTLDEIFRPGNGAGQLSAA